MKCCIILWITFVNYVMNILLCITIWGEVNMPSGKGTYGHQRGRPPKNKKKKKKKNTTTRSKPRSRKW